jgi:Creatinine amidohydrolase
LRPSFALGESGNDGVGISPDGAGVPEGVGEPVDAGCVGVDSEGGEDVGSGDDSFRLNPQTARPTAKSKAPQWNRQRAQRAREDAGLETNGHEDMHTGELETSILLAYAPELVRAGNEAADWTAERPHLLTLGMAGYTKSGVIGRPSLGTADKGLSVMESLVLGFDQVYSVLVTDQ